MLDRWPLRHKCHTSPPNFSPCRNGHWHSRMVYSRETAACRAKNNLCWNKGLLKERVTFLQIGWHVLTNRRSLFSLSFIPSAKWRLHPFISQLSGNVFVQLFLAVTIHFTGLARSLSLSPVTPDNHCICALFSHRWVLVVMATYCPDSTIKDRERY